MYLLKCSAVAGSQCNAVDRQVIPTRSVVHVVLQPPICSIFYYGILHIFVLYLDFTQHMYCVICARLSGSRERLKRVTKEVYERRCEYVTSTICV